MIKQDFDRPVRVIICGDRNWTDEGTIAEFLSSLPKDSVVIHGACVGADVISGRIAKELGFSVEEYPARWDIYGNSAGPIRNRFMLENSDPDVVAGFHDNILSSRGTKDMLTIASQAGLTIFLFNSSC